MVRAWVRAVWALGALMLLAGTARADCTKDIECEGELVCEAGSCVEPAAPATPAPAPAPAAAPPSPPPIAAPSARAAMAQEPKGLPAEPPPDAGAPLRYKRRSRALMTVGIVASSLGTLALLVAASSGEVRKCSSDVGSSVSCTSEPNYGPWVLAGVLLGAGIPMIAVGSKRVPDRSPPRATLTPWVTWDGGGLGFRLAL